ncbi:cyclin-like protein [Cladochytrium replicatum]|nr:cyclin-like protein [Cladochytrium replicatum]
MGFGACLNCGGTGSEFDDQLGHTLCTNCGNVLEENRIVSEVGFSESATGAAVANGFMVSKDSANARGVRSDSREQTIANGHRRIAQVASQMNLKMKYIEEAQRYYNLAVANNFNKGRRIVCVVAACLYIVCRMNSIPYMLIDFSEALRVNVFVLGATFLRLVQTLNMVDPVKLPLVDPILYITRYASKLEFEDKTPDVIRDANRLVKRFSRDWLHVGRRPNGICAACLFIAARMHGFNRTKREIVRVVKICEATLQKRLDEFQETPSSKLTVSDFQTIWLEEQMDPPAFLKHKKRAAAAEEGEGEDEDGAETPRGSQDGEGENEGDADGEDEESLETEMDALMADEKIQRLLNTDEDLPEEAYIFLDDDADIRNVLLEEHEIQNKTEFWMEENKDWLEKQEQKRKRQEMEGDRPKRANIKRKKGPYLAQNHASAAEAATNMLTTKKTLSKKINYNVLTSALDFDEDSKSAIIGMGVAFSKGKGMSGSPAPFSVTGFGTVSVDDMVKEMVETG